MSKPGTLIHISQQTPLQEGIARCHLHQGHTDLDVTPLVSLTLALACTRSSRTLWCQRQSNQRYASVVGRGCVCPCTQAGWLAAGPRSPGHHLSAQLEVKTQIPLC